MKEIDKMRDKLKFNDLVRMVLLFVYDNRKGETKAIYLSNKDLFNEDFLRNKGIIGLLSDWRQKYGIFSRSTIENMYSATQVKWLINEIKQARITRLDQLDARVFQVPKSNAMAYAKVVEKRVDWKRVQKYVDFKDKTSLMTYLSR